MVSAPMLSGDVTNRSTWVSTAATVDRLNRSSPHQGLEAASEWLARERAGGSAEGIARALRAHAHALRFLRIYDEAIEQYEEAEARFYALGLPAEAARTQIGHVSALRFKGRYQEAVDLGVRSHRYFVEIGDDLQAAKQAQNLGTVYRPMGRLRAAARSYNTALTALRAAMLAVREQYDHPYFWAPFMVIGDGLTTDSSGTADRCGDRP